MGLKETKNHHDLYQLKAQIDDQKNPTGFTSMTSKKPSGFLMVIEVKPIGFFYRLFAPLDSMLVT